MPCNTAHFFLPELEVLSPVPFLSILDVTAQAAKERFPGKTAAILATTGTVQSGLYQHALDALQLPWLVPDRAEQDALMRVIYDGVKAGAPADAYREDFNFVISSMKSRGGDYFVLGCTELPLAAQALALKEPLLDPTEELARAAVRFAGYPVRSD